MAAKAKKAVEPTIDDKANELINVRAQIKQLQEKESVLQSELKAEVLASGRTDFGDVIAYERTGVAKLEGLENKALKVATEQLINSLDPTYVKKTLDVGKMYAALQTDKSLLGHLAEKGLKITQQTDWYFKQK